MDLNIGLSLSRNAARTPNKIAFKYKDNVYTYKEMNEEVNRLANGLIAHDIKKGDKVALMMKNSDLFVMAFYAVMKAGAVAVPINFRLTKREVAYILDDSDACAIFFYVEYDTIIQDIAHDNDKVNLFISEEKSFPNSVNFSEIKSANAKEPDVEVSERDDAEILYTSGTTGNPKGALFDHLRILEVGITASIIFKLGPEENLLHVAPLFHSAQLNLFLISGTYLGRTQIIHDEIDPLHVLETIEREKISFFFAIPTMYNFLLQVPQGEDYDLSSVTRYGYGAAPMPVALINQTVEL